MSYKIISKFIKDISFEIPNTQAFVMLEKEISNYSLNFDIKSNSYKKNIIEVNTLLKIIPNQDVKHKILTEIACITLVLITAFVTLVLEFLTTLNVACNSSSALVPNNILYFTGWYIIWSDNDFNGFKTPA